MLKSPLNTVFYNIEKAIKLYRRMAHKSLSKQNHKITLDQILVLWIIEKDDKNSQVEIAALLFKDIASITRMIESLVKKGYLKRDFHHSDRRRYILNLTKNGKEVLNEAFGIVQNNRTNALNGISPSEIETLNNILSKIINNCQIK